MSLLEMLTAARELITPPEHWTTYAYARNARLRVCSPVDPDAQMWCALGACMAVLQKAGLSDIDMAVLALEGCLPTGQTVSAINDYHGHAATLELFDCAIKRAQPPEVPHVPQD